MNKKQVFRKIEGLIGRVVLCVCLSVCTLAARAQDNLLTVNLDKVPLSEAIAAIEGQSRYLFMLGEGIDASAEFISVHAEKQPLREVLDQLIRGSRLAYSIEGQNILLSLTGTDTDKPFTVRGRVSDRTGAPVIGAAVLVKGTTIGTSTGLDGSYTLEIPAPAATAVLTVNFLGYAPMEILVGQRSQIDFALREEAQTVDAVVVTALGIKRSEKALSYNVQQVNSEDIVGNKDANFINSLNGKVAGVNINASSSGVGGASKVVMRGSKAISQSSNALYVIDGIPMFNLGSEGGTEFDSRGYDGSYRGHQSRRHRIDFGADGSRRSGPLRQQCRQWCHRHHYEEGQGRSAERHRIAEHGISASVPYARIPEPLRHGQPRFVRLVGRQELGSPSERRYDRRV